MNTNEEIIKIKVVDHKKTDYVFKELPNSYFSKLKKEMFLNYSDLSIIFRKHIYNQNHL
jgi:hypothetical protein